MKWVRPMTGHEGWYDGAFPIVFLNERTEYRTLLSANDFREARHEALSRIA